MDIHPKAIIDKEIKRIDEEIQSLDDKIEAIGTDLYRSAVIAKVKGENFPVEAGYSQLRHLNADRKKLLDERQRLASYEDYSSLEKAAIELRVKIEELSARKKPIV